MKRREFITLLGGAAAWPLAARAQQPAMPVIGYLGNSTSNQERGFHQGLSEAGFADGRNVSIEYRWAEGHNERLPEMAADLVRRQVAVIVANSPAVMAAKAATATIPIVFFSGGDPVELGLVASFNRPGGNLTGVTTLNTATGPKRLELLHECIPTGSAIGLLVNPTGPSTEHLLTELAPAARTLGLQLHVLQASNDHDLDTVFPAMAQLPVGALLIGNDAFFTSRVAQLAALAVRHAVPAIYQTREFAAAGGLMSYGANQTDAFRLIGVYTGRILKGEKPSDLPVQQATKVELTINLKTAKTLGITFPITLLGRADEVIE